MVNLITPSTIIFINSDISDNVKSFIQKQLFIDDTMIGTEFDARLSADPNYVDEIHSNGLRVLVIRPFTELTNRDKADIVLFIKNGLASIEQSKYGPPGKSYRVETLYLSQLCA